jgi:AcrR family transcriptional regulator
MAIARQGQPAETSSGRTNQKVRTRRALIAAAVELIREGKAPSMPDVADRALMSPATAYRYFPNAQALWEEASFEIVKTWDADQIDRAGDDPRARLDAVVAGLGWHMLDDELPYRNLARAGMERWYEQSTLPANERVPVREGRRMAYNAKVVEPLRRELPAETVDQLINALALVWGTEAVLVLRDVCGLETSQAKDTMLHAARWMLDGFLAEHPPLRPQEPGSDKGSSIPE